MKHQLLTLFIFCSIGGAMAQDSLRLPVQSQSLAQDTLVIDSLVATNVTCFGDSNGQITVHASGGNGGTSRSLNRPPDVRC